MRDLLTFVILAFACYRITRLAILDAIFDSPRDRLHAWLLMGNDDGWRNKRWVQRCASIGVGLLAGGLIALGVIVLHEGGPRWVGIPCFIAAALAYLFAFLFFSAGPTWLGAKIEEMIGCPYCLSIWVGLGLQLMAWPVRSIPLPVFYFLALSGSGMVVYQYIDFAPEEEEEDE